MTQVTEPWPLLLLMAITWSPCHIPRDKWIPRWGLISENIGMSVSAWVLSVLLSRCVAEISLYWSRNMRQICSMFRTIWTVDQHYREDELYMCIKLVKYLWRCSYLNMSGELVNILYADDLGSWTSESPAVMTLTTPDKWGLVLHQEPFQPYAPSVECPTGSSYDNPSLALNSHLSVDNWQKIHIFIYVFITMTSQWAR